MRGTALTVDMQIGMTKTATGEFTVKDHMAAITIRKIETDVFITKRIRDLQ